MALVKTLRESKSIAYRGKITEALSILEKVSEDQLQPSSETAVKVVAQIATFCIKLSFSGNMTHFLSKADRVLLSWICSCNQQHRPVSEKIINLLLLTMNNWASFHQNLNNNVVALSCINRHLKFIEESSIKKPKTITLMASTLYNASSLYIEIRSYKQAILYANKALSYLQKGSIVSGGRHDMDSLPLIVSCHYNIGIANQLMNKLKHARDAFGNASRLSKDLTKDHYLINIITNALKKLSFREKARSSTQFKLEHKKSDSERYYSEKQLDSAKKQIANEKNINFINSDKYFYNKISSMLKVEKDVKNIPTTPVHLDMLNKDKIDRQHLNKLRLRKHTRKVKLDRNLDFIQHRIAKMKEDDQIHEKLYKIKTKSKMKALERIERKSSMGEIQRKPSSVTLNNYNGFLIAKDGIELIMSELTMDSKTPKKKLKESMGCELARSAIKNILPFQLHIKI